MLTLSQLRTGLAKRIVAAGYKEAPGVMGVEMEPSTVIDRAFSVVITEDSDAGERVRSGERMMVTVQFVVRIVHKIGLKGGPAAYNQALDDGDAIRRALLTNAADSIKEMQNTITYGGSTREEKGGGAYQLTTQRWACRINTSLVT
jgi:hypothetical protein